MSMLVAQQVRLPRLPVLRRWAVTPLAWALLATAFLLIAALAGPGPSLSDWLGDPDDAVRLMPPTYVGSASITVVGMPCLVSR